MLSLQELNHILEYAHINHISEKNALKILYNKNYSLTYYKKKYNINYYNRGKNPNSHYFLRKHNVNDNFFNIDNLLNYYYAGFIAADGYIDKTYQKLIIGISTKDINWLNTFKTNLNYTGNIFNYNKKFDSSYISISSRQICNDLKNKFNILNNKSLIYSPPIIFDNYKKDAFIMGLIDGDGCICKYKINRNNCQDNFSISLMGTYNTVIFVQNRFSEILNIEKVGNISKQKKQYVYRITTEKARKIFIYFYENYKSILPVLQRKWPDDYYNYCKKFKRLLHPNKRKGVYIFDLNGNLIKYCDTLKEADVYTGVSFTRISALIKMNDNKHSSNGYMFSRNNIIQPYEESKYINKQYSKQIP